MKFFLRDATVSNVLWPCHPDGTRPSPPERPSSAPPVYTGYWTSEQWDRYYFDVEKQRALYDEWHSVWGPVTANDVYYGKEPFTIIEEAKS